MTKKLSKNPDKIFAKHQVAFLASEGLTQKQIASLLSLSQSTISIMLQEAVSPPEGETLLLDPRPRFLGNRKTRERIQKSLFVGELQGLLDELSQLNGWSFVPKVFVGIGDLDNGSWDSQVKTWSRAVAPSLVELLKPCKTIAVSWGRQLRGLVEGIASLQIERRTKEQALVFATWPPRLSVRPESDDKVFRDHVALGSNALAFDLSVALNGEDSRNIVAPNYLPGIDMVPFSDPPFILEGHHARIDIEEKLKEEKKFLDEFKAALFQIPAYSRIFGDFKQHSNTSLLRRADAAILPSGPPGGGRSFAMGADYGGIPLEWFSKNTLGDIGGVIIPSKEPSQMSSSVRVQFERLRNHWLGVWEEDVAYIAKHGKVGTIVGAVGSDRTRAIHYGFRKQLIRYLFCDPALAKSLTDMLSLELKELRRK